MSRLMRPALLLMLVAVTTLPALADKAKDLFAKGQDAEARQHYDAGLRPLQAGVRIEAERPALSRSLRTYSLRGGGHDHASRAETARGRQLEEAVAEFQKALAIDPSLFIAQQELTRTLQMIKKRRIPPQAAGPPGG